MDGAAAEMDIENPLLIRRCENSSDVAAQPYSAEDTEGRLQMDRIEGYESLYVFACKGIQDYIFRSDKLRPMVGASELVDDLPDTSLSRVISGLGIAEDQFRILSRAAGGARILFCREEDARKLAEVFPLLAKEFAPGLEVVQAIVPLKDGLFPAFREAEESLRARRNLVYPNLPPAGPLVKRNQRSGLPAEQVARVKGKKGKEEDVSREVGSKLARADAASMKLIRRVSPERFSGDTSRWPLDFDSIASDENAYIGIVHADANSMGQLLISLAERVEETPGSSADIYESFSRAVETATEGAVRGALEPILSGSLEEGHARFPVRPIVCAGDDLTVVVAAPWALSFLRNYLERFEELAAAELTKLKIPGVESLTACGGIAFVKKSFPFSQAYDLAESLCKHSKKALERRHSALAFWRQTASAGTDYESILKRELTVNGLELTMNPYRIGKERLEGSPLLSDLETLLQVMRRDFPRGSRRGIVSAAYSGFHPAQRSFERMCHVAGGEKATRLETALSRITGNEAEPLWTAAGETRKTPLYDAIELDALKTNIDREAGA